MASTVLRSRRFMRWTSLSFNTQDFQLKPTLVLVICYARTHSHEN